MGQGEAVSPRVWGSVGQSPGVDTHRGSQDTAMGDGVPGRRGAKDRVLVGLGPRSASGSPVWSLPPGWAVFLLLATLSLPPCRSSVIRILSA